VVLWRHGQTEWNTQRRFQGQIDVPLDDVGKRQAVEGAKHLAALDPAVIVSSDLLRASQTAAELATLAGLDVQLTESLRETNAGEWQGMYADDLKADPTYLAWMAGEDVRAGGAETRVEVADRAVECLDEILTPVPDDGLAVVVSHGGTIRGAIGRMLGLPVQHWGAFGGLANCCWSVLGEQSSRWRLVEHNASSLPQIVLGDDR
jgi:probable phosphoglycerate mutase